MNLHIRDDGDKPITRLSKDLREASKTMSEEEARYLVDAYYIMQDDRKRAHNQVRAAGTEPHAVIAWLGDNSRLLENWIKISLDIYTENHAVGRWIKSNYGLGPVLAAGLLAHIDIKKAPTVGHIWRYAGMDPTQKWEKGKKRPWNAGLKVICWKIGQSFMKFSNVDECFYGRMYREQKQKYISTNDAGGYAERAAKILTEKKFGKDTEAYKHLTRGKLPPAQIDAMARRWAVKLFLSHLHDFWYQHHFKKPPPLPYPIAVLGHAHRIDPKRRDRDIT
jgi:hypothetical protein